MIWILTVVAALAGYGDAVDGLPSHSERELHMWTNVARVAPQDFESSYTRGGCSVGAFTAQEQTGQAPVLWEHGLNDAARFHSTDMFENDHFSHDSSDGTSFFTRLSRYYPSGFIGENIAWGADPFTTVFEMWMCSPGHRSNIMEPDYEELGTGVASTYMTQDFGARGVERRAIAMGVHLPQQPSETVEMYADFWEPSGRSPNRMIVVLDGVEHDMRLKWGQSGQGVYSVELDVPQDSCHAYFFRAFVNGTEVNFPEDGSYGWGDCTFDDEHAMWWSNRLESAEEAETGGRKLQLTGCSSNSINAKNGWIWVAGLFFLFRFRHTMA